MSLSSKIHNSFTTSELDSIKNKKIEENYKNLSVPNCKDIISHIDNNSQKKQLYSSVPLISISIKVIFNIISNKDNNKNNLLNSLKTTNSINVMNLLNDFFQNVKEIVLPENSQKFDFINDNIDDSLIIKIIDDIINKIKILKNNENNNNLNKNKELVDKEIITDINRNNFMASFVKEVFKEKLKIKEDIKSKMFENRILNLESENEKYKKEINELKNEIKLLNIKIEKKNIPNVDNIYKNYSFGLKKGKYNSSENINLNSKNKLIKKNFFSENMKETISCQSKKKPRLILGKKIIKKKQTLPNYNSLTLDLSDNRLSKGNKKNVKKELNSSKSKMNISNINSYANKYRKK